MTEPGVGGVPNDPAAVWDGIDDLICDAISAVHAIRTALEASEACTPALFTRAPDVQ